MIWRSQRVSWGREWRCCDRRGTNLDWCRHKWQRAPTLQQLYFSPSLPGRLRLAAAPAVLSPDTLFWPTSTMSVSQLTMFTLVYLLGLVNNQRLCMVNLCVASYHLPFKNIFHVIPRAAFSPPQGYFFLEYELASIFRNQVWKTRDKLYFMWVKHYSLKYWLYGWNISFYTEELDIRINMLTVASLAFLSVSPRDLSHSCEVPHKRTGLTQSLSSSLCPSHKVQLPSTAVGSPVLAFRRELRLEK